METKYTLSAEVAYDYKVINTSGAHTWIADEPLKSGGQDEGPNPKELLLSALASCMLITLRMYAQKRGWDAGDIHLDLEMVQNENGTVITKDLQFSGDLEHDQLERLLEISDRCPVARILQGNVSINLL